MLELGPQKWPLTSIAGDTLKMISRMQQFLGNGVCAKIRPWHHAVTFRLGSRQGTDEDRFPAS